LGYNYRLSDIHASLGLSQLQRADAGLLRRREIAKRYETAFQNTPVETFGEVEGHAYHLYVIRTENRKALYNHLREKQIFAQVHYIPVHTLPYYRALGNKPEDCPHAMAYYKKCLSLPMFPSLTDEEQDFVIQVVLDFVGYE
jgi:dTDP-4-amino-4,6-dideoxygalactose transaminase